MWAEQPVGTTGEAAEWMRTHRNQVIGIAFVLTTNEGLPEEPWRGRAIATLG